MTIAHSHASTLRLCGVVGAVIACALTIAAGAQAQSAATGGAPVLDAVTIGRSTTTALYGGQLRPGRSLRFKTLSGTKVYPDWSSVDRGNYKRMKATWDFSVVMYCNGIEMPPGMGGHVQSRQYSLRRKAYGWPQTMAVPRLNVRLANPCATTDSVAAMIYLSFNEVSNTATRNGPVTRGESFMMYRAGTSAPVSLGQNR